MPSRVVANAISTDLHRERIIVALALHYTPVPVGEGRAAGGLAAPNGGSQWSRGWSVFLM